MTINGGLGVLMLLSNAFPRAYPLRMSEERARSISNQFAESFKDWQDDEVFEAVKKCIAESTDLPTIAQIRHELIEEDKRQQAKKDAAFTETQAQTYEKPSGIVCVNGVYGRWMHRDAINAFLEDLRSGGTKGGHEYYYKRFPEMVFEPLKAVQP